MSNLQHRQQKIQDKRKQTPWREFVMDYCSFRPLVFYKNNGFITQYPSDRNIFDIVDPNNYDVVGLSQISNYSGDFFDAFRLLRKQIPEPTKVYWQNNENSNYASYVASSKNVYLSNTVGTGENILYSLSCKGNVRNVCSSLMARDNCENVFQSAGIIQSYNIFLF
ncbi:MAG TPA: hypothetical protein PLW93_03605 [Candidatus Absconditabacterales bacterium]|nr:hypothetical protein [Candidatus Absconditabacterales bacterium]HNG97332.1 hypothetical protein [Candidatus Absconditabacterales bacterium]